MDNLIKLIELCEKKDAALYIVSNNGTKFIHVKKLISKSDDVCLYGDNFDTIAEAHLSGADHAESERRDLCPNYEGDDDFLEDFDL